MQQSVINKRLKAESAHYYNYGDRPLKVGNKMFTGHSHMPTPTKTMHFANSNSLLGNAKGAHDVFVNTLPKIEMIVARANGTGRPRASTPTSSSVSTRGPSGSLPDVFASCTNPFLQSGCSTPMARVYRHP